MRKIVAAVCNNCQMVNTCVLKVEADPVGDYSKCRKVLTELGMPDASGSKCILSLALSLSLSLSVFFSLSLYLSIYLSVYLSIFISVSFSLSLNNYRLMYYGCSLNIVFFSQNFVIF